MKEKWAKIEISADHLAPAPSFNFCSVFTLCGGFQGNECTTSITNKKQWWTVATSHVVVQNKALSPYFGLLSNIVMEIREQGSVSVTENNHFSPPEPGCRQSPSQERVSGWLLQLSIPWLNVYPHPNTSVLCLGDPLSPPSTGFVRTVWEVLQNQERSSHICVCVCIHICSFIHYIYLRNTGRHQFPWTTHLLGWGLKTLLL